MYTVNPQTMMTLNVINGCNMVFVFVKCLCPLGTVVNFDSSILTNVCLCDFVMVPLTGLPFLPFLLRIKQILNCLIRTIIICGFTVVIKSEDISKI